MAPRADRSAAGDAPRQSEIHQTLLRDERHRGDYHHQSQGRRLVSAGGRPPAFRCLVTFERSAFNEAYWGRYWERLEAGGAAAVAHYLRTLDLKGFNPKAPPPRTQAFYEMVNAMRSENESEMEDILDHLGRPKAILVGHLISRARTLGRHEFAEWLKDGGKTDARPLSSSKTAATGGCRTRSTSEAGG